MHLWDVQRDDELVFKSKSKIKETLDDNLKVVGLACNVYDEYLFILKEKERIEAFLSKEPFSRDEFQKEIDKFKDTIEKIREEMPYEIRMNMFLVQCSEINNNLCEECQDIIQMILRCVSDYVFVKMAPEISNQVKSITEELGLKSTNSAELVDHEKRLEEIKVQEHKRLIAEYNDMIDWLVLLNKNPQLQTLDESIKPIYNAHKLIGTVVNNIEKAEGKLRQERQDIENALIDQTKRFNAKIDEQKKAVHEFKDKTNVKQYPQYIQQIEDINKTLKYLLEEGERINKQ